MHVTQEKLCLALPLIYLSSSVTSPESYIESVKCDKIACDSPHLAGDSEGSLLKEVTAVAYIIPPVGVHSCPSLKKEMCKWSVLLLVP